jgi:hypothetical protein
MKAMKKSVLLFAVVTVAAGLVISLTLQHRARVAYRDRTARVRQQADQLAELVAKNRELAQVLDRTKAGTSTAVNPGAELAQLRAQAESLQAEKERLEKELAREHQAAGSQIYAQGDFDLSTHNHETAITFGGGPRAAGKLNDARVLTAALRKFADEHGGAFPQSLDQAAGHFAPPLDADSPPWQNAPVSGTNSFEIIYQGSQSDLTNIPPRRVALVREPQPWQAPDGNWARTYGYADGSASIVESDDNFQSWDAQHVIPPAAAGQ